MSKHVRVCSLLVVAAAIFALPFWLRAEHSWGNYHWARTSNPFTLKVGNNVHSGWGPYLDEAIVDWNKSNVLSLQKVAGGTTPRQCKATNGRIEVCAEKYGFNGWLGVAQIWVSGSHITKAIAKVNDSYFNTATYNKPEWRRLVMCQEIAHDFGLDHQDENFNNPNLGSCMDYTSNPLGPPSNEHPNKHDYDQIQIIYSHNDSTSTIASDSPTGPGRRGQSPPAMDQIELEGPGQWGRLIRGGRDKGFSVYELDFGGGHRVITRVIWTLDSPRGRH